jgi:hypothetical protein
MMNTVRPLMIASLLCLTAMFGCYSQRITDAAERSSVCHVDLSTNGLPSLTRAMNTLVALENAPPKECGTTKTIKLHFTYDPSDRPFLSLERSQGRYWFYFEGKYLPRERWGKGERWATANCDQPKDPVKEVTCASRVTSKGEVQSDAIWGNPTRFGSGL